MSAYYCQGPLCDPEGRAVSDRDPGVPEREAELIRGGQLYMCRACAAEQLRSDVMEIGYLIARLSRDADDYAAAGLLPDALEAQINSLVDVAKAIRDSCGRWQIDQAERDLADRRARLTGPMVIKAAS